jgi:hypothetical protein
MPDLLPQPLEITVMKTPSIYFGRSLNDSDSHFGAGGGGVLFLG